MKAITIVKPGQVEIREIEKPVRSTLATVRLIPSIVMEPFSTI